MRKIISINIGGRIISIAHNALQMHMAYIETLHSYFINEEGYFEIINDIESRIAELMEVIINDRNTCINEMDVKNIIRKMGTADEFKELDAEDQDTAIALPENAVNYLEGSKLCSNLSVGRKNAASSSSKLQICL